VSNVASRRTPSLQGGEDVRSSQSFDRALLGAMVSTVDNITANAPDVPDECHLSNTVHPECAACMGRGRHACSRGIKILRQRQEALK